MNNKQILSALEAVLFASGDPVSTERLSQVFDITAEDMEQHIAALQKKLDENQSGFQVVRLENTYQLATKKEYAEYVKRLFDIKRKSPLSPAALEVLAVIAYNQPVTRAFVEQVRGVDCSGVISTLLEKELIEERGRLELPGRPLLYGTTKNFLRCFSIDDLSDLPSIPKENPSVSDVGEQLRIEETAESTVLQQ